MSTERDELAALIYDIDADDWRHHSPNETADAILAAGYRKLEPEFLDTLSNDGTHEFTVSADCDGSNTMLWRRTPKLVAEVPAGPWEVTA
ncbi:hypothetical protein QN084_06220 [Paenarthrobacter sp. R1]|uniref:hypothetical protein n=1 Tax=Paenarthrobacter sp. R1 TaxID=3049085 RepID=UPI0025529F40|nr:hypothetical protein [Paenarthrobacter sp. R1]WIV32203.1 hypothetical protein QN084_06220 [Paenarthrobacter sp. R1]